MEYVDGARECLPSSFYDCAQVINARRKNIFFAQKDIFLRAENFIIARRNFRISAFSSTSNQLHAIPKLEWLEKNTAGKRKEYSWKRFKMQLHKVRNAAA
jgi:hypothetical protein